MAKKLGLTCLLYEKYSPPATKKREKVHTADTERFLNYTRAIDLTIFHALSALASEQV